MKNLFDTGVAEEVKSRIQSLKPSSTALWGKMNVAQMLAHCVKPMEVGLGEADAPPSGFIKKLFGRLIKGVVTSPKPYKQSLPTDPTFVTIDKSVEFDQARNQLLAILDRYVKNQDQVAHIPHPFFGKLTKTECGISQFKHLDHHLKQFGA